MRYPISPDRCQIISTMSAPAAAECQGRAYRGVGVAGVDGFFPETHAGPT